MERRAMPVSKKAPVKKPEVKKVEPTQEQLDMQKYLGTDFPIELLQQPQGGKDAEGKK